MDLRSIPARYQTPAAALFILLMGTAWATAWGWKQRATDDIVVRELQRSIAVATSLSNALLPRYRVELQRASVTHPSLMPRLDFLRGLGEDVGAQIRGQRVAKVQIHDSRGVVVYSTDRGEIGLDQSSDLSIRRALRGDALADLSPGGLSDGIFDSSSDGRDLVHAFVPANAGTVAPQEAVFAVYSDVSGAMADVRQEAHNIWGLASLAGLTLFGIALRILRLAEAAQRRKDAVTGLPGRENALVVAAEKRKAAGKRQTLRLGWLVIGVQRMRQISAAYGHRAATDVLRQAATRLQTLPDFGGRLFSLGGEAFALLVVDLDDAIPDEERAERLARSVLDLFESPIECMGHSVLADLAIGISLDGKRIASPEELLNRAEVSMTEAKRRGSRHWLLYYPGLEKGVRDRLQSMGGLREALEHMQFQVYYQPLVDAKSHAWIGCEALLRWNHPINGMVMPESFVPLLEETSMIGDVWMFVMREACRQGVAWRKTISPQFTVSVNLSARQFADPELLKHVRLVLDETKLPAKALTIEVTETFLALEPEYAAAVLAELRRMGVSVAIDDFGVGYSALSSLRRLPVDILKIDRSFVTQAPYDPVDASIAKAIAALARGLDLTLVAEGVETESHAKFTAAIGCDKLQGYLFAKPLDAATFEAMCPSAEILKAPASLRA